MLASKLQPFSFASRSVPTIAVVVRVTGVPLTSMMREFPPNENTSSSLSTLPVTK
jgi:hypothetical protein